MKSLGKGRCKETKRVPYSSFEISYIKENYADMRTDKIAIFLNRPIFSIYMKAFTLGLKKSPEFLHSEECGRLITGHKRGISTQFKKGQVSHNKGKKMTPEMYIKAQNTFFKKGHLPHNTKEDGVISIRYTRGRPYIWIRISLANWQQLHRIIWTKNFGPIPDGYNVQFIDGNSLNCEIENLKLVSKKENMQENTIMNYPIEIVQSIHTLSKLKRIINGKE